ncbi:MAG: ammonium transporter [Pseudomonadota bacterium]
MTGFGKTRFGFAAAAAVGAIALSAAPAHAAVSAEAAYVFNTLLFLIGGFLVMWMAAGFAMLEAGLVRTKNVAEICLKNIGLYSIAGLMYYVLGYNLMYGVAEGGYIGPFDFFWSASETLKTVMVDGEEVVKAFVLDDDGKEVLLDPASDGYASGSDWFFQMVFVATAASIVSGTVAERVKLFPFFAFVVILTGLIYPIQGSWEWGAGWLDKMGFADFAGSTLVHSTGGWAALAGAMLIGARKGKYDAQGRVRPMPGSSLPLATLGTFILWVGWFGFNGASQLALGSDVNAIAVANIFANTNMAAAAGCVAAMTVSKIMYKKVDLTMALNGALAGLVSITAEPLTPTIGAAILIGAVGGMLAVFAVPFFDKLKIDDVVGALSVHLVAGIWGTMAVPFTNDGTSFLTQFIGVVSIGAFVFLTSYAVWMILKLSVGIRLSQEEEEGGSDMAELGMEAYPEFGRGTQKLAG